MNAGRLRHRIDVQQRVATQADTGELAYEWQSVANVWGAVEPLRGRESVYAGEQILGEMDTRITVRYSPATAQITAGHRLVHQGTLFNVVSVAHVRLEQREIEILCKSGISDG